jgi:hypothetical protein
MNFKLLRIGENTIEDRNCKYCNKCAQYYRYKENDYTCKEHLFGKGDQEEKR